MRENLAEIIRFHATDEIERGEVSVFVRSVVMQTLPMLRDYENYLFSGPGHHPEALRIILEKSFENLTLIWLGLAPEMQRAFEDSLVDWWKEFKELRAQTKAKADAVIAKHANGHSHHA
jgi:hypothetical protein